MSGFDKDCNYRKYSKQVRYQKSRLKKKKITEGKRYRADRIRRIDRDRRDEKEINRLDERLKKMES